MKKIAYSFIMISFFVSTSCFSYTGEVIKSIELKNKYGTGLTYDGKNLWVADRDLDQLICINPASGEVIKTLSSPGYWPVGLAWDGEFLWNADLEGGLPKYEQYDSWVYKINPKTGEVMKSIQAPTSRVKGIAWDGKYLWCVDNYADMVYQFSPNDGTTIKSFKSPATDAQGITFDGKYLWISDRIKDEIYMVDPETGWVLIITRAPGPYVRDLCYDGKSLWATDYQDDKLYQLKIRDGEKFRKSNKYKAKVTYNHQVSNFGPGKLTSGDIHIAIPEERVNQKIEGKIEYSPAYTDVVTDQWGQKTARFHFENLEAGKRIEAKMMLNTTTYNVRYFIYPEDVGTDADIPAEIKEKYLVNDEKFQYDHPEVQNAVKEAVGDETNLYWKARKIYQYIFTRMYYEMSGGWNTAPAVLARGNGSCSEYSFVCISMYRAAGLPARYVGSFGVKKDKASMDEVFHRWVEVYLPGYGWIPVDASRGNKKYSRDQGNCFGFIYKSFCITTQSGGGSETLDWNYNSFDFYSFEPKSYIVSERFADYDLPDKK